MVHHHACSHYGASLSLGCAQPETQEPRNWNQEARTHQPPAHVPRVACSAINSSFLVARGGSDLLFLASATAEYTREIRIYIGFDSCTSRCV